MSIKTKLNATAVALLITISCNTQAEGLVDGKVYGRIIATVISVDQESINGNAIATDTDNWQIASNASRLGFKGKTPLDASLNVIYQIEYEISTDDGLVDNDEFGQRNIFIGLEGAFGSVLIGKHDTPFKRAQYGNGVGIDQFDDLYNADIANLLSFGEVRHANVLLYNSPNIQGFSASAALMPGEQAGANAQDNGLADSASLSVKWQNDQLYVAAAIDSDVQNVDAYRLVSHYRFENSIKLGLIYQSGESADSTAVIGALTGNQKRDGWIVSAAMPVGAWVLAAQTGNATLKRGNAQPEDDISQWALRSDYVYNDRAKLFLYYSGIETDTNDIAPRDTVFGAGIDYNF